MSGNAQKSKRKFRLANLKHDPAFLDNILEAMSSGVPLMSLAAEYDVAYNSLRSWLCGDESEEGQARAAAYMRAKLARADYYVNRFERNLDRVEYDDDYDPKRAKVVGDGLRWLAEVHNPESYGNKQQVTHQHQGSVQLHLQAVRELSAGATYQHEPSAIEQHDRNELPGSDLL